MEKNENATKMAFLQARQKSWAGRSLLGV
jgi:hypothetical protein